MKQTAKRLYDPSVKHAANRSLKKEDIYLPIPEKANGKRQGKEGG